MRKKAAARSIKPDRSICTNERYSEEIHILPQCSLNLVKR